MSFIEMINALVEKNNSLVCVGLDTDPQKLPKHILAQEFPIFEFNKSIIDATADLVCAYKPQIAYYSAKNAENQLEMTIQYIHKNYPGIPVILDAKRNDIGSTAAMYAEEAFLRYQADAVTVNPYLGQDALDPFIQYKEKGVIILCRTSNPGARQLQDLLVDGEKLYQRVAKLAVREWNYNRNILLVVGATYPAELKEIRHIVGDMILLVPGIGAQGGDVKEAVLNGKSSAGAGMIINASRSIIYASNDKTFSAAARKACREMRDQINQSR
ncbi:MAG: orotidine-5'-phosphate decarboxylase [Desulfobacteraceae bacterium]|nr:MAG: orotidine-5'-phosphate decarboxylase [Desulfobacteraceae bacterium]